MQFLFQTQFTLWTHKNVPKKVVILGPFYFHVTRPELYSHASLTRYHAHPVLNLWSKC
jgi:hypothetical protein